MRDDVRGVVAAALVQARRAGEPGAVAALSTALEALSSALVSSEPLRRALTDPSVPVPQRRAVVADLLADRGSPEAPALAAYVVGAERAPELPGVLAQVEALVAEDADRASRGEASPPEPQASRSAVRDRLRGFAEQALSGAAGVSEVDAVEEELFGFARILERNPALESTLGDTGVPLVAREGVLGELVRGKVSRMTEDLLAYVLRAGRVRSLARTVDWLAELTALERGRRIAEVRTAADLDQPQRERLAQALGHATGRQVELRVVVDPEVIGGAVVSVGDTVIDGTLKHRLAQLREVLGPGGPASQGPERAEGRGA